MATLIKEVNKIEFKFNAGQTDILLILLIIKGYLFTSTKGTL